MQTAGTIKGGHYRRRALQACPSISFSGHARLTSFDGMVRLQLTDLEVHLEEIECNEHYACATDTKKSIAVPQAPGHFPFPVAAGCA